MGSTVTYNHRRIMSGNGTSNKKATAVLCGNGTANKEAAAIWVGLNGNKKLIHSSLTCSISPSGGLSLSNSFHDPITGSFTVTATKGVAPYSYSWSIQPAAGDPTVIESTSGGTCNVRSAYTYGSGDVTFNGQVTCVVTDAAGATATLTDTYSFYFQPA